MDSDIIAGWVAENILPWEGLVRNWLRRRWGHAVEVDDILQEAYCRIASLDSVDHIANGKAYFFTTVRSVALDSLRRAKTMGARGMTEMDWSCVLDEAPLADQAIEARHTTSMRTPRSSAIFHTPDRNTKASATTGATTAARPISRAMEPSRADPSPIWTTRSCPTGCATI
jgi:DNA-directed RNA polymerase specialized sigma24 family protein